ncbi:MAG: tetratricopeptide repeat protein [Chloroflexi bacterium]|nr:tetratricopeptide repeat protein [Chloroflexota bacterium]
MLVMEYVAGETLADRLRREARLPLAAALTIAVEIARALHAAHAQGIVHRDLKPQNVALVEGQVKVLDFGIATAAGLAGLTVTAPGALLGTPEYCAPEQAEGRADARTDLYALGVLLYQLLTGRPPFSGPTPLATLHQHRTAPLPPLPADVPAAVQAVVARCLAKDPAHRFQTAAELLAALSAAKADVQAAAGWAAREMAPPAGGAVSFSTSPAPSALPATQDLPIPAAAASSETPAPALPPPSPRSLPPHYLPAALTRFVGRERELVELRHLLTEAPARTRLLTLTGPGGAGKTRLAVEVARAVLPMYPDGVWLVEMAALADPALVPQAVAAVLGVREQPGQPLPDTLAAALAPKRLLLVLDNCEHLVAACASLAERLLRACPHLRLLATSRAPMGSEGETTRPVPPLATPDLYPDQDDAVPPEQLLAYDAVQLFVDRAVAARPDFALTAENARAIGQICHRLDGLPLALELAAARVPVLTPAQIAARLDDRFRLLTGGRRTALPRQQTLRATLDWSHASLAPAEQSLFRRLAVFAGGWTLEAAEAVCADAAAGAVAADATDRTDAAGAACPSEGVAAAEVLDLLARLVEKSLVVVDARGSEARFRLLETVRAYAAERLGEAGEAARLRARHATWYLAVAEQAESGLRGQGQEAWLGRLEREHDNFRAALAWSLEGGEAETGTRLAAALWHFWAVHGHFAEGRRWLERALQANGRATARHRARALNGAGNLAWYQGDLAVARAHHEACLALRRELGDQQGIAASLNNLGLVARAQGDYASARAHHEESLALRRRLGDRWSIASSLNNLGLVAKGLGDHTLARAYYEESLALSRELGNKHITSAALNNLGIIARVQGDHALARAYFDESLALRQELEDRWGIASALGSLGQLAADQGDHTAARSLVEESLALFREVGNKQGIADALNRLGEVARCRGDYSRAAEHYQQSLALFRELGAKGDVTWVLHNLGHVAQRQHDQEQAAHLFAASLSLAAQQQQHPVVAGCLAGLAGVAHSFGKPKRAARLLGAAAALLSAAGAALGPVDLADYERNLAAVRAALDGDSFTAVFAAGQAMSHDESIAYALKG